MTTRWRTRLLALGVGCFVAFLAGEALLRLFGGSADFVVGSSFEINLSDDLFTRDPELGFRPRIGTSLYDANGTLVEPRTERPDRTGQPVQRILFLGDSVTRRATLVEPIRTRFGTRGLDYFNAGVESFDTQQEVEFYLRYNHKLRPHHVILTLHHNDFAVTPLAMNAADAGISIHLSNRESYRYSRRLYKWSHIYRLWTQIRVQGKIAAATERGETRVRENLARLAARLRADGIRFTVLVLPLCKPESAWHTIDRRTHELAVGIVRDLGIEYFDLRPSLASAAAAEIPLQETPHDPWHPSAELGNVMIGDIVKRGFTVGR